MICSVEEVKKFLRITSTEYDTFIKDSLIPLQDWIEEYCRRDFISKRVRFRSNELKFENSSNTIINEDGDFGKFQFVAGIDIVVSGSFNNEGLKTVGTASSTELEIDIDYDDFILTDEDSTIHDFIYYIDISKKQYPKGLKLVFSKLIGYNIQNMSMNADDQRKKSENFKGYSYVNGGSVLVDDGSYPNALMMDLKAFRNRKVVLK